MKDHPWYARALNRLLVVAVALLLPVALAACSVDPSTQAPDGAALTPRAPVEVSPSMMAADPVQGIQQALTIQTVNAPWGTLEPVRVWVGTRPGLPFETVVLYQRISTSACQVISLGSPTPTRDYQIKGSLGNDFMELIKWSDGPGLNGWPNCSNISSPTLTGAPVCHLTGSEISSDCRFRLYALAGNDILNVNSPFAAYWGYGYGGDGNDSLYGYGPNAKLYGELDNDKIWKEGIGNNDCAFGVTSVMDGGGGDDCLQIEATSCGPQTYTCGGGTDAVQIGDGPYLTDSTCEAGVTSCF